MALGRRGALGLLGSAAGGVLVGCRSAAPPDERVWVPLTELAVGRRMRVLHGGRPVEVRREPDGSVAARSLMCTHMGCEVRWDALASEYRCPCHAGRFDARGRVLAGSPTAPLPTVRAEVIGDAAVVGG